MTYRHSLIIAIFMAMATLTVAATAFAGAPTDTVKSTSSRIIAILQDSSYDKENSHDKRRARIREAVYDVFDFREMAMRTLARNWRDRTPKEKDEFTALFSDLLERSYINRIEGYSGEEISYDSEEIDDNYAEVKTRFITDRKEEYHADYKLIKKDGTWKVYDIILENVSLVNNYRVQFNKIISSASYEELVKKMTTKLEDEQLVEPAKSGGK
jgi:phospholipid transport system substrate-binding protein